MRIFYKNVATSGGVSSVVVSSSGAGYAGTEALHPFRKRLWKTGTTLTSEFIELQFPAAVSAKAINLVDHNFVNGSDTLTLKANTSSSWGSPAFSQALTVVSGVISQTFAQQTHQYWRLEITKSSAANVRQIGVLMLSDYYDTPEQPDFDGYKERVVDPSKKTRSIGGQLYVEQLDQYRFLKCKFSKQSQTFKDSMVSIYQDSGFSKPIVAQVETSGTLTTLYYGRFSNIGDFSVTGYDASLLYDHDMEIEEEL